MVFSPERGDVPKGQRGLIRLALVLLSCKDVYLSGMKRWIFIYSLALALGAFLLSWLEYQYLVRVFPLEIYLGLIAALFTGVGIWLGNRLTRKKEPAPFEVNTKALNTLGISQREQEVLALLANGQSNQQIADSLFVSINTIKTHIKNLYAKLEVSSRTQAVQKARDLHLIP